MADICPFCKSGDVGHGFDLIQCFSCGGHFNMDGTPAVPTSALDPPGATYSGVGKELVEDPDNPPFQAERGNQMIGRGLDNGRYGGGSGGSEDRFHFPAVDAAKWDEAKTGRYDTSHLQGEAGQVIGSYVNTMDAPRGKIMGATINCCWPENGFMK